MTPLAEGLSKMVVEWVDEALRTGHDWKGGLPAIMQRRLDRYISADKIATILSEHASLQNGNLNVGYLAVKIAETIEGKQQLSQS